MDHISSKRQKQQQNSNEKKSTSAHEYRSRRKRELGIVKKELGEHMHVRRDWTNLFYVLYAAAIDIKCLVPDIQRAQGQVFELLCAGERSYKNNRPHQLRSAPVQAKVIIVLD